MEGTYTEVVVGVDGSAPSRAALRWAAAEAGRRALPLRIRLAYHWRVPGTRFASSAQLERAAQELAELTVHDAVAEATAASPGLAVSGEVVLGDASWVLMSVLHPTALAVVGSHGHNDVSATLLGSVGLQLATCAPCPVMVVRGRSNAITGPVLVGVDGSPAAERALGVAFEQAASRGSDLLVVRAFRPPEPPWLDSVRRAYYRPGAVEDQLLADLHHSVEPWHGTFPRVRAECRVVVGRPGAVLVDRSRHAALVVVGSRGHGGFAGLLLGSVSHHLLHRGECTVLVVPEPCRVGLTEGSSEGKSL